MRLRLWIASIALACTPAAFVAGEDAAQAKPQRYAACYAMWIVQVDEEESRIVLEAYGRYRPAGKYNVGLWTSRAVATGLPAADLEGLFVVHLREDYPDSLPGDAEPEVACFIGTSPARVRTALAHAVKEALQGTVGNWSADNKNGKSESEDWADVDEDALADSLEADISELLAR